jgi:hypothetical protein
MARYTIDIPDAMAAKLQAFVQRWNEDNGRSLTVTQFLTQHVREMAVQDELAAYAQSIKRQKEDEANAAFMAERQRLMDDL